LECKKILEGGGHIHARVIDNSQYQNVVPAVYESVEPGSHVYTDQLRSYFSLQADYVHDVINHPDMYVNGQIHTNGLENFWSLLKRGLDGTYVSVEPFHLFRYVDEQAFRYNHRKDADGWREVHRSPEANRRSETDLQGTDRERGRNGTGRSFLRKRLSGRVAGNAGGTQMRLRLILELAKNNGYFCFVDPFASFGFGPRLFGFSAACFRCSSMRFVISAWETESTRFIAFSKRVNASVPSTISGCGFIN
jgi:hypothetical protein